MLNRLRVSLRALRHRDLRLFFTGQWVSLVGTWMQRVTVSWHRHPTSRIVREVTVPAFVVLLLGSVSGLALARSILPAMMVDTLFGVSPTAMALYAWAAVILVVATVPALVGPAVRSSKQNPVEALRRGVEG